MATLNEIAYNIKNLAYGGSTTTSEESVGIRQIKFWIHYYRAMFIKEQSMEGRGVHTQFLQEIKLGFTKDFYNTDKSTWQSYLVGETENSSQFIIFSERTRNLAGDTVNSEIVYNEDYYGRDFENQHTAEEKGDYGLAVINLPNLLHVDGYGIKNLRVKRNYSSIDLPVVSINELRSKKYNRFTSKSPAASIDVFGNEDKLIVSNLKSVYKTETGTYSPILYTFYANALYADPTDNDDWTNDDIEYPIPDILISELNRRILTQEMGVIMQSKEDTIDDERDSTNVQQAVQGQVPNRQRRTR